MISIPWISSLPSWNDDRWTGVGKAIISTALNCDTGKPAFDECCVAREQLETIVQSIGYDMHVYIFGGLSTMRFLEVGGDADFVGVADIEPGFTEASIIVSRLSRELRRLGFRTWALPKARVPVIKADRVSKSPPGSAFHNLSCDGVFQFARQMTGHEVESFENFAKETYGAKEVDWSSAQQTATVQFRTTSALIYALSQIKRHGDVEIPFRLPVDVQHGPEIYRFPFDFCLSSTGLRNSYLFGEALSHYPYSRHLLLILKKWGRSSGIINPIDGLLASYAITVMVTHFLVRVGAIPKVSGSRVSSEPQLVPMAPTYTPLEGLGDGDPSELGYLLAAFFEYFGRVFNYAENVVCATKVNLTKKAMNWDVPSGAFSGKPPFFDLAIKDPYGLDNIGRNLDADATLFVKNAHDLASKSFLKELGDPTFAIESLTHNPPKPVRQVRSLISRGIQSEMLSPDQLEARYVLKKMAFHERRKAVERFGRTTIRHSEEQRVASNVTKNVLGWIKSDDS